MLAECLTRNPIFDAIDRADHQRKEAEERRMLKELAESLKSGELTVCPSCREFVERLAVEGICPVCVFRQIPEVDEPCEPDYVVTEK